MSRLSGFALLVFGASLVLLRAGTAQTLMSANATTIVKVGDPVPGLEGITFSLDPSHSYAFNHANINNHGDLFFSAYLYDNVAHRPFGKGAFIGRLQELTPLLTTRDDPPGLPEGTTVNSVSAGGRNGLLADDGSATIFGQVTLPGGIPETEVLWNATDSQPNLVQAYGLAAIGTPEGVVFGRTDSIGIANGGWSIFSAHVSGPGIDATNDYGVWRSGPNGTELVAREGQPIAGQSGSVWGTPYRFSAWIDDQGTVTFSTTGSDGIPRAIWKGQPDHLELVAQAGQQAPGLAEGVTFGPLSPVHVNPRGQTLINANLLNVPGAIAPQNSYWLDTEGEITLVARTGEPSPGAPNGATWTAIQGGLSAGTLNDRGEVAFIADFEGGGASEYNDQGLWLGKPGELRMVARKGQVFDTFTPNQSATTISYAIGSIGPDVYLNNSGQVVFSGTLGHILDYHGGPIVDEAVGGGYAVFATNTLGQLVQLNEYLRLDGSSYSNFDVDFFMLPQTGGGTRGMPTPLNDAGQLMLLLQFGGSSERLVMVDLNVPGVTFGVLTGENQHGEVGGAPGSPGTPGHVAVTFPRAEAGIFKGWFHSGTPADVAAQVPSLTEDLLNNLPGAIPANAQVWNLEFTGSALEPADLSLTYDASLLGDTDESSLGVRRLEGGRWWRMASQVDPAADLLHVATDTFGILALSVMGPLLPADLNGDDLIDALDISSFVQALVNPAAYVASRPYAGALSAGDFTGDGLVNALDIAFFVDALTHAPTSSPVPEPASALLLLFSCLLSLPCRR